MKYSIGRLAVYVLICMAVVQGYTRGPHQQEVNFHIEATLIDSIQTLEVEMTMQYINQSPDVLYEIFMHLWGNAYKHNQTAFARQLIEFGDYSFHFARDHERGGYEQISFLRKHRELIWSRYNNHEDVAVVYLEEPLMPGDTLTMDIHYRLRFPDARFSRLGHHKGTFYATQWYPKPAVYNAEGWHPMPYLHMGEFFSEFGNVELKLTLPACYVVASSGILQNPEEKVFLNHLDFYTRAKDLDSLEDAPDEPPVSATETKTLHFIQENVHDFAWFADQRFMLLKDSVTMPDGQVMNTYVFFTHQSDLWKNANTYLKESLYYMSAKVGPYPWGQITAVQGWHSGGANMEYPAITLIGQAASDRALERVIVHENIHNWFYGMLASNERVSPWLDEGFTTYFENRFFAKKYPGQRMLGALARTNLAGFFNLSHQGVNMQPYLWYQLKARQNLDQPMGSHTEEFSELNYYIMAYFKAAMSLKFLEKYMGTENFDRALQSYYQQWSFKHPTEQDLRNTLEKFSPHELDWFFDSLVHTSKKIDLQLTNVEKTQDGYLIAYRSGGDFMVPFPLAGMKNGEVIKEVWVHPTGKNGEVFFGEGDYDAFRIDPHGLIPEISRRKNSLPAQDSRWNLKPLELQFLGGVKEPEQNRVYWLPVPAYNLADGFMPGLAFYNTFFPPSQTEIFVMPLYSTQRDHVSGTAWVYHHLYPDYLQRLRLGAKVKRYGHTHRNQPLAYFQAETSIKATLQAPLSSKRIHTYVQGRNYQVHTERLKYTGGETTTDTRRFYVNQLNVVHDNQQAFYPYTLNWEVQQARDMLKTSVTGRMFFPYNAQKDGLSVRVFAGSFLKRPERMDSPDFRFSLQGATPMRNPAYAHTFFGLNQPPGNFWGHQMYETDGGLKFPTPLGQTWRWLASINLAVDIPGLPLRLYYDQGTWHNAGRDIVHTRQFPYVAGVQASILNDMICVNFPMIVSDDLSRIAKLNKLESYYQQITFIIRFDRADPFQAIRDLHLLIN